MPHFGNHALYLCTIRKLRNGKKLFQPKNYFNSDVRPIDSIRKHGYCLACDDLSEEGSRHDRRQNNERNLQLIRATFFPQKNKI